MCLCAQQHNVLEVRVIYVGIDTEKSFEDHLDDIQKVLGEGHTQCTREDFFIVQLVLYPGH